MDVPDLRPATPLIRQLEPWELGYGTPGGGSQLPRPCRALGLTWQACAVLAGGLGLTTTLHSIQENAEGVPEKKHGPK